MIGQRLAGLELLELIGLGGAAEVYRARDPRRGQDVAVKVLSERADPEMVLRFRREAHLLSELKHPHIVEVYEAGEERGLRYMVMELMHGGSLKDRLRAGALPWRDAAILIGQIAQALSYAHERHIVHRDIKPGNIMFTAEGRAKLMDFGLARMDEVSTMTRTGTVMGTVFYLSPEQAVGRHVDGRSDLYALGVLLYEMLTGQLPFTGNSAVAIIYKHLNEQPPRLRSLNPALPVALDALVERLLAKDANRRPQTAGEVYASVEAALLAGDGPALPPLAEPTSEGQAARLEQAPLAGRREELAALTAALERALAGAGGTVMVVGPAGMGKTRLTRELELEARERNVLTLRGECLYADAPNPYAPFIAMLHTFQEQQAILWARGADEDEPLRALLGQVQGVLQMGPLPGGPAANAPGPGTPLQVFELLAQFLLAASRQRALLLVLDDMQWASPTTLQLFHHLARAIAEGRILLLGTYRPEDALAGAEGTPHPLQEALRRMGRERLVAEVRLQPLAEMDIERLVADALEADDLDADLLQLLARDAEGNPFYLLEALRLLQAQGLLAGDQGRWRLASPAQEIAIPETVADLVLRRVQQVDRRSRELLDWGAVMGARLDARLLAEVTGEPTMAIMRRLYGLEQDHALIAADAEGFYFGHGKVQQVLYDAMPPFMRRESHLMLGKALEARGDEAPDVYALARHFVRAGDARRGYRYSRAAADRAEAAIAFEEALALIEQAAGLLEASQLGAEHDAQALAVAHQRGRLLANTGRFEQAVEALREALAVSRRLGDRATESDVLLELGLARGRLGFWSDMLDWGGQSLALAEALDDGERMARALTSMGFFAFEGGDWAAAMAHLERALGLAEAHGLELLGARIRGNMGIIESARGHGARAIELLQGSVAIFGAHAQSLDVGRGLNNMGMAHRGLGDLAAAERCYTQALDMFTRAGDVREQGIAFLHLGEVALEEGELAEARTHCTQATRRFARIGFELGIADVDRVYAGIARREGRRAVSERYLREAIAVYETHGDQLNMAETHADLASLLEETGKSQEAREQLEQSQIIYRTLTGDAESSPG